MKIKLLAMDVDGTLTDGHIYIGADGEAMKAFDVKDGYAIVKYIRAGGIPVIITGRSSAIVEARCRELGISELWQGVGDKLAKLRELAEKYNLTADEIAYIGDDENDVSCLKYAGLSACPADAMDVAKAAAKYICRHDGGRGAVRELLDKIMSDE